MSSAASSIPYFGRAWDLTVFDGPNGNVIFRAYSLAWEPEPLRVTFDIYQTTQSAFWYADISIYNLNDVTLQAVLTQGMYVQFSAGYQTSPACDIVFEGTLFQPMWEKENGVDYRLTLHCLVGVVEETNNFIALSLSAGLTQRQIVSQMAANANYPLDDTNVNIPNPIQQSRGSVVFGQPSGYFQEIASSNQLNYWISSYAVNIRSLLQSDSAPTIVYGPNTGLIGTPQQTQDGINFRVNLDPRAALATQIQLSANTTIRQLPRIQGNFPTVLDPSGYYAIAGVRHVGDSRGNDWFTELTCYTYVGSRLALLNP